MTDTEREYKINSRFKEFVDAYAEGRHITVDEALNSPNVIYISTFFKNNREN